jgi:hypothetical protein
MIQKTKTPEMHSRGQRKRGKKSSENNEEKRLEIQRKKDKITRQ